MCALCLSEPVYAHGLTPHTPHNTHPNTNTQGVEALKTDGKGIQGPHVTKVLKQGACACLRVLVCLCVTWCVNVHASD